ncbi:acyl-CoA thioesterase-1 [Dongia mobilis]|uniref:Acyl-CoA thioesterase-1 n=1 Tax=Dongia mobilis TaxID=578943 RepID=A0A4R6WXZ6_9PROT|nr:acyl-CoA thioesterase-1 [Dongia mobilis]
MLLLAAAVVPVSDRAQAAEPVRILAFGDSLTAGYGLPQEDGFVPQLQQALDKMGRRAQVINGGVSGDTTAGGVARLDWMLADRPDIVILELGANDALRGLPPEEARRNLETIIQRIKDTGAEILLAGMLAPRNMGEDYADAFDAIYPDLAAAHQLELYPFFLEGVATRPELNQGDGIHPTREGVAVIVEGIMPQLARLLDNAS